MASLSERAAAIGRQARAYEDAKGASRPAPAHVVGATDMVDGPRPSDSPPRWHWVVYLPDGTAQYVVLDAPMTQAQVRGRFPESLGAVPW